MSPQRFRGPEPALDRVHPYAGLHSSVLDGRADFAKKLQDMKSGMVRRTAAVLTAAASEAVKTLLELQSPTTPPAIRLQAARHIIELGVKLRDASELQDRIAALEQQVGGDNTAPAFIPPPHELPGPTLASTPQEEPAA